MQGMCLVFQRRPTGFSFNSMMMREESSQREKSRVEKYLNRKRKRKAMTWITTVWKKQVFQVTKAK